MDYSFFELTTGNSPIVGAAIHNGHEIRENLKPYIKLSEPERLREEDPYTDVWAGITENSIIVSKSRFEVDLNRPRDKAVYQKPEDAWGLTVWKEPLPTSLIEQSLSHYDAFYEAVKIMLRKIHDTFGYIVVLDIHSYNHKRNGAEAPAADLIQNPDINIGTSNMDRKRWAPVVEGFMDDLRQHQFMGKPLDVRENVKFKGGYFSNWIHNTFPGSSCSLAVEFKKIFMDEWTGILDYQKQEYLRTVLSASLPGLIKNSKTISAYA